MEPQEKSNERPGCCPLEIMLRMGFKGNILNSLSTYHMDGEEIKNIIKDSKKRYGRLKLENNANGYNVRTEKVGRRYLTVISEIKIKGYRLSPSIHYKSLEKKFSKDMPSAVKLHCGAADYMRKN